MKHRLRHFLLALILVAAAGPALAATYSLPASIHSGVFSDCSLSSGITYTCTGSLSIGSNDTINFTADMILEITGSFSLGNNSSLNGDPFSVTISTSGDIDIGNSLTSSVNFKAHGNFSTGNTATVMGNIIADGNIVTGNSATVTGNISATGDVSLGSNTIVNGNVDAGGNLSVSSGTITGTCTYQTTNYNCSGSSRAAGFSVIVSTTTASSCSTAGGTPPAPWITITAMDSSGTTVTSYTGTITISGIGSGTLSKKTANGTLSGTSYTFASADNGVAVFYLADPSAEIVTPSATDGTASGTSTSSITFSDNVLVISDADTLSPTYQPVAGRIHKLTAAVWSKDSSTGNCSINTKFNSTASAKMWITATPSHPSGATSPSVSTANSCPGALTLPSAAPASNNVNLTFTSGSTTFYLCTTDVGQYSVNILASSLPGAASGTTASNTLTVVPFAIIVSGVRRGTTENPGATTASGTVFISAGTEFQATVAAYLWNSGADSNNDGLPDSGVNSTNATAGGTVPRYAQTVTLNATVLSPIGGRASSSGLSTVSVGSASVTNGSITATTLAYPEVGSFTLSATPAANYLGAADLSSRVLIYSKTDVEQNSTVGRFTPAYFNVTVTHGCTAGSFTYAGRSPNDGQSFTATVTAKNATGGTTENYSSNLKDSNGQSFVNPVSLSLVSPATGATLTAGSVTFTQGSAPIKATLKVPAWTAAFSSAIRATDSVDSISSSGYTEGTTNFRIGRVRLMNSAGSERLDLPVSMRAEYWQDKTSGWVLNSSDSCTGDTSSDSTNGVKLTKGNSTNNGLPDTAFTALCAWDSGSLGEASDISCATAGIASKRFLKGGVAGFAGNFQLNLAAPGSGNTGTVTITANVPTWLQYPWTSPTASNPSATATFGKARNNHVVFRREMY